MDEPSPYSALKLIQAFSQAEIKAVDAQSGGPGCMKGTDEDRFLLEEPTKLSYKRASTQC